MDESRDRVAAPTDIDEYIASRPPDVRPILARIRAAVHEAVPEAVEAISYGIPTFMRHGVVLHFAAFKRHIGIYPPVQGDAALMAAVRPYLGDKGNLRLPLDQPMPYDLVAQVVSARARRNEERAAAAGTQPARRRGTPPRG